LQVFCCVNVPERDLELRDGVMVDGLRIKGSVDWQWGPSACHCQGE
jgi:hypothetical protein